MSSRPEWNEYFVRIAEAVAQRGDCTRSQVGAVLVNSHNRIVSTGYNGVSPGAIGCIAGGCPRGRFTYDEIPPEGDYSNCVAHHAEWNAVMWCKVEDRANTTLYTSRRPCNGCQCLILSEGITKVVWRCPDGTLGSMRMIH